MSDFKLTDKQIEMINSGYMNLGPTNKRVIEKFSNICQEIKRLGLDPPSLFLERMADRLLGKSKQSFELLISGQKGSGKSYSALSICNSLSKILSRRSEGAHPPEYYFTLKNSCILSDPESVNNVLRNSKVNQLILIDDTGATFGSRTFQDKKNQAFNRILAICRTKRWGIIYTVPVRSQTDLQIRQLSNYYAQVYKSNHAGGFNLLKIFEADVIERKTPEMISRRLVFEGHKFEMYCCFAPPEALAKAYDILRERSANEMIEKGGYNIPKKSKSDRKILLVKDLRKCVGVPNFAEMGRKHGINRISVKRIYEKEIKNATK
jgi:hypothetical protein